MKKYLKLIRINHYLKNFLIFLPLIFSGNLLNSNKLIASILSFIAFCFTASIVYIINDIKDVDYDRKHLIKKNRPIASGQISIPRAWLTVIILIILSMIFNYLAFGFNIICWLYILVYVIINLAYSYGLKNIPLLDIVILVIGFLIRILYGSSVIDVEVSNWLYLTVMSMSFYLGLGKRRNEIIKQGSKSRLVLEHYNQNFLDKNMYMCLALTIVFYSLWCVDSIYLGTKLIWTVPLVVLICMKYSLNIEKSSYGDPVDVFLGDKILITLVLIYGIVMLATIYVQRLL